LSGGVHGYAAQAIPKINAEIAKKSRFRTETSYLRRKNVMKGNELLEQIKAQKTENHFFVKWWRKEQDFLDFDLIERFVENVKKDEEFADFELLDMEQMWGYIQKIIPGKMSRFKLTRAEKKGEEVIEWEKEPGKERIIPYNSQSLIDIFDMITKGDVID
jgi:hypothetical protein